MSNIQKPEKALEVKIRTLPAQERQDQKDVSRVFLSSEALLDLGLEVGQTCHMWKIGELGQPVRGAVAWLSSQRLNKNVVQMFKTFQEACGFRLEDRIIIAPGKDLQMASTAILRETSTNPSLSEQDRGHWEWYLEDKLARAEIIFYGMSFNISLKGPKRSFTMESFVLSEGMLDRTIARFQMGSIAKIVDAETIKIPNSPKAVIPRLQLPNIAGLEEVIRELNDFFDMSSADQILSPSLDMREFGVILHGCHGTGKTLVLRKLSETGWGKVFYIDDQMKPSAIRDIFKDARQTQRSIIIIDDIHLLFSKEQGRSRENEKILGEEIDRFALTDVSNGKAVSKVVIAAATSSPNDVPQSMRNYSRFSTEINIPVPDADSRKRILRSLASITPESAQKELIDRIGDRTHAYTGRDLEFLLRKTCQLAAKRNQKTQNTKTSIYDMLETDFDEGLRAVGPSAMHDITLKPPKVRWHEIGGNEHIKKTIRRALETPLKHPDLIQRLGVVPKKGLLLYGPPGCSKTLLAQAMATEINFNFFAVKGAELLNMYVGESERAMREIFARARAASPSIIFFDEIESIGSRRSTKSGTNGVNILTTLLNELDGIEALKGVTVLAATNQPEALDVALLRPGRFDELFYVAPPDARARADILQLRMRTMDCDKTVEPAQLARDTDGYSGAELVGVCNLAAEAARDRALDSGDLETRVSMADFGEAVGRVKPQITAEMVKGYERWAKGLRLRL